MEYLINEFNVTAAMCVEFILSVTNDSDLRFYKKAMDKLVQTDKTIIIEQFIIHCLPHYKHFMENDEKFFIELKSTDINIKETSLIEVLKLRKYFISLNNNVKELIFEYLKLLCNYSKEYLQTKLNNGLTDR